MGKTGPTTQSRSEDWEELWPVAREVRRGRGKVVTMKWLQVGDGWHRKIWTAECVLMWTLGIEEDE